MGSGTYHAKDDTRGNSRRRRRSRSPHDGDTKTKKLKESKSDNHGKKHSTLEVKEVSLDAELTAEEIQMMLAMGIPFGFDSTQGKHVDDTAANQGAVKVATKRSARQYMNRKGGFNKALPAEKTGEKVHIEGYARR